MMQNTNENLFGETLCLGGVPVVGFADAPKPVSTGAGFVIGGGAALLGAAVGGVAAMVALMATSEGRPSDEQALGYALLIPVGAIIGGGVGSAIVASHDAKGCAG